MECFKLFDRNLVDDAVLTPSSVNALYPVSNIKDERRSKVFRSTSNTTNIVLDLQETQLIDSIFLVADKKNSFGFSSVTVEFNATSDFTSPAYSVVVPLSTKFGIGFVEFAQISYRFARIVMTSTLGYCELSKIYIGKKLPLTRSISFNWTIKDEELSTKQRNRYGQLFVDLIGRQKVVAFALNNFDKNDLTLINSLLDHVGESKHFYILLGNENMVDDYRRFSGPVILDDVPTISNPYFNKYKLSMTVRELT